MLEIICEKREFQRKPDAFTLNQNYMDLDVSVCILDMCPCMLACCRYGHMCWHALFVYIHMCFFACMWLYVHAFILLCVVCICHYVCELCVYECGWMPFQLS